MKNNLEFQDSLTVNDVQTRLLRQTLEFVFDNSKFYKRHLKDFEPEFLSKLELSDLNLLPFTTKDDLQLHNDDFTCVDEFKIADYSTTSGTLGAPVSFALSDNDLERLAYNEAISFECAGIKAGDKVQLMTTMDRRFMAGLAYFLGLRKLGAGVIRVGSGIPQLQWDSILKFRPKYIVTVPSFILKLIDFAETHNIDFKNSGIEGAICIGEPLRNNDFSNNILAQKIAEKWDIKLFSTYASTEMSTAFTECEAQVGGHQHPDLIIIEVVDEQGNPVENGNSGELVFTTLGVEAMPLIRFKTGDIVTLHSEVCACGRTSPRVGPVIGRKQQMIKYKGTTLYPPAMSDLLNNFDNINVYQIIISNSDLMMDEIEVLISAKVESEAFLKEIRELFRAKLRVAPNFIYRDFEDLKREVFPENSRKPIYIVDRR